MASVGHTRKFFCIVLCRGGEAFQDIDTGTQQFPKIQQKIKKQNKIRLNYFPLLDPIFAIEPATEPLQGPVWDPMPNCAARNRLSSS